MVILTMFSVISIVGGTSVEFSSRPKEILMRSKVSSRIARLPGISLAA